MECIENFVIKVNVMFWCNGCVASINLNLNSVFKILIPCNYSSLAGGGVLAVLATLHCPVAKVFFLLSFLPLFLCSLFHATESLSAGCWVSPAAPGSECLIGIVLNWQWLVSSAQPPCHILIALVHVPRLGQELLIITVRLTAAGLHFYHTTLSTHSCSIRILLSQTHGGNRC